MAEFKYVGGALPAPGSQEERRRFARIQERLAPLAQRLVTDPGSPQTVVVVPSLSLDAAELAKISGVHHYEERLLCMLMLLRLPRTHLVLVTSQHVPMAIVDYYLHLLPGVPLRHARRRLTLLSCHDASDVPLTRKILDRPRLVERIRSAITDPFSAHLSCFNSTALERSLAVRLGIPLYGNDPALNDLGTKSGGREVFREAGVPLPDGFEHLRDDGDIAEAIVELKRRDPGLRRVAIKLNEGFSGEGNAVFSYDGAPENEALTRWVRDELPKRIKFEANGETWERYLHKFAEMGGIVECWVEGEEIRSPSVQCRINPLGEAAVVSTHDQVLGGPSGQIFLGSSFPADEAYSRDIKDAGERVGQILKERGALGRFAIDFISVKREDDGSPGWDHQAIEINLRKGGTTHPYLILRFLTDGSYDADDGTYCTPTAKPCYYYASDNIQSPAYKGLTPDDLVDIAVDNGLHFDSASQQGVVFHLIGALSQYGKLGAVCIGDSHESARKFYRDTVEVLDRETQR
ncbi:MAG TPA: peptide ligase PGM1-related protein [Rubrobacteraceae bacterium]|nr:peptide ligase PGM1-related protein [Rubrobacteraceae bacterium]